MTLQPRILIVDDEPAIREMLVFILRQYQYQLYEAESISQAQQLLANIQPDLILLDWMLPGGSGIDLLRQLKREASTQSIPVVMLTAKTDEDNKVQGLEFGADDYINKPFSPKELVARIRAVLRRVLPQTQQHILTISGLNLDTQSHRVYTDNHVITLGPTEFKLLHFFMSKPDRVYNREQLLNHVWGLDAYIDERTIDVHIRRLRKALVQTGHDKLIQTVRGSGYRLSEEVI